MDSDGVKLECPPEVAELVSLAFARDAGIFPLDCSESVITFAVEAPLSDELRTLYRFIFNRAVREVVHPRAAIQEAIARQLRGYVPKEGEDETSVGWVWPAWYRAEEDGTLLIKSSGWDNGSHWTGAREIRSDAPDFAFWAWLTTQKEYARLVDERELPEIYARWECLRREAP
jgi:hypothetical protein